jgi:hypothetical protein
MLSVTAWLYADNRWRGAGRRGELMASMVETNDDLIVDCTCLSAISPIKLGIGL